MLKSTYSMIIINMGFDAKIIIYTVFFAIGLSSLGTVNDAYSANQANPVSLSVPDFNGHLNVDVNLLNADEDVTDETGNDIDMSNFRFRVDADIPSNPKIFEGSEGVTRESFDVFFTGSGAYKILVEFIERDDEGNEIDSTDITNDDGVIRSDGCASTINIGENRACAIQIDVDDISGVGSEVGGIAASGFVSDFVNNPVKEISVHRNLLNLQECALHLGSNTLHNSNYVFEGTMKFPFLGDKTIDNNAKKNIEIKIRNYDILNKSKIKDLAGTIWLVQNNKNNKTASDFATMTIPISYTECVYSKTGEFYFPDIDLLTEGENSGLIPIGEPKPGDTIVSEYLSKSNSCNIGELQSTEIKGVTYSNPYNITAKSDTVPFKLVLPSLVVVSNSTESFSYTDGSVNIGNKHLGIDVKQISTSCLRLSR